MGLLDFIFPKRCVVCGEFGSYLCREDKKKIKTAPTFCPVCLKAAIGGTTHAKCQSKLSLEGLICLFDYSTPVKEIIHELKYRFVKDLVGVLTSEIRKAEILAEVDFNSFTLLPIPLSRARENWRGFNQAKILGELIAHHLRIDLNSEILRKIKETKPQVKLPKKERFKQARGVFKATDDIGGRNFLVFDDVWTTGATMKAAAAALKRKGAGKVWGIAFATSHSVYPRVV